jgi:hypothetical protein
MSRIPNIGNRGGGTFQEEVYEVVEVPEAAALIQLLEQALARVQKDETLYEYLLQVGSHPAGGAGTRQSPEG